MAILREPTFLCKDGKYDAALESLDKHENLDKLPRSVRANVLRAYGEIYAAQGKDAEAWAKFDEAWKVEGKQ